MINLKTKNWQLENIELVVFDKDGTFIDIHKYWGRVVELRAKEVIKYFGMNDDFFESLCKIMGYDLKTQKLPSDSPVGLYARGKVQEILLYFLISNNIDATIEDIENIFQTVGKEFIKEQEEYTITINDAVSLIKKLNKTDCKMVVVTSDSRDNAIYTVKKHGLDKYFEGVYGAEDSKEPKTTGDVVKKVLSDLKIEPEKTVCIGDTYDDFLMAKNSKIKACINVSTGIVTKKQHSEYNKFVLNSLSEIESTRIRMPAF